jgi:tetratricopeptide (TPR) repeat protein
MRLRIPSRAFLFSLIPLCALAQQHNPQYGLNGQPLNPQFPMLVEQQRLDAWFLHTMGNDQAARPEKLPDGISKLDLMAPGKARSEYDKGFVESYRQNFNRAVVHFEKAVSIFPRYFAAHNALGTVYMRLGMNEKARASVTDRFVFEQKAATEFLQHVLTDKNDQAFVTGFANTVLMVQDFTNNRDDVAASIRKLAPTGGTALWGRDICRRENRQSARDDAACTYSCCTQRRGRQLQFHISEAGHRDGAARTGHRVCGEHQGRQRRCVADAR